MYCYSHARCVGKGRGLHETRLALAAPCPTHKCPLLSLFQYRCERNFWISAFCFSAWLVLLVSHVLVCMCVCVCVWGGGLHPARTHGHIHVLSTRHSDTHCRWSIRPTRRSMRCEGSCWLLRAAAARPRARSTGSGRGVLPARCRHTRHPETRSRQRRRRRRRSFEAAARWGQKSSRLNVFSRAMVNSNADRNGRRRRYRCCRALAPCSSSPLPLPFFFATAGVVSV